MSGLQFVQDDCTKWLPNGWNTYVSIASNQLLNLYQRNLSTPWASSPYLQLS